MFRGSWFHRHVNAQEAERALLNHGKDGSFLVRPSQNQTAEYILSARVNRQIMHIPIARLADGTLSIGKSHNAPNLTALMDYCLRVPIIGEEGDVTSVKQPLNATRFNLNQLSTRISELEKVNDDVYGTVGFTEEFQALQQLDSHREMSRSAGQKACNRAKNRYKNILPYDKTRIVLQNVDDPDGDYINANYISNLRGDPAYIATQAPLQHTIEDFWCMVFEQDCRIVINTTTTAEEERQRTIQYWPHAHSTRMAFGAFHVERYEELEFGEYVRRAFRLTNVKSGATKDVWQFHYLHWPDRGVPDNPSGLLNLIDDIHEFSNEHPGGPWVVHCSAGIGRTGTFIAIDMLKTLTSEPGQIEIDVQEILLRLRKERSGMVQTEAQYKLCFTALLACQSDSYRQRMDGQAVVHQERRDDRRASSASTESLADQMSLSGLIGPASTRRPSLDVAALKASRSTDLSRSESPYGNIHRNGSPLVTAAKPAAKASAQATEDLYGNVGSIAPAPIAEETEDAPIYGNLTQERAASTVQESIYGNL